MKKFSLPKIKIKISSSFPVRTLCKYCLTGPTYYFRVSKKKIKRKPDNQINYKHYSTRLEPDDFIITCRSLKIKDVSYSTNFIAYNPKIHRQRKLLRSINVDDILYCECSLTNWAFNVSSSKGRKEIEQRKSKITFDKKFTY